MSSVERLNVIVYEGNGAVPLGDGARSELFSALLDRGYGVTRVRDHVPPARTTPRIVVGAKNGSGVAHAGGAEDMRDITGLDAAAVVSLVDETNRAAQAPAPGAWKPWFPVIDYSRCTNCMQCLSFCLFDVYGVTAERQIQVQNPTNCKTECPACSRVCPEVAIMFPKYRHAPINGDVVSTDDVRREAMKVDISALLGGDVYSVLRDRSAKAKSRFSKERDEDRALRERQTCLVKLQQQLDVPPEVLAALPSVDEIRARAEAAAERARAATAPASPAVELPSGQGRE
jgi:Pyruvate/2-oxoacid:ferredoxin oxidoreductase delta subunit